MHLTLKQETANPPAENRRRQQHRFDEFRQIYNEERPHEALGQVAPAKVYQMSPRLYTGRVPTIEYPAGMLVRRVAERGQISWRHQSVFLSETLAGEYVGLEPIDERHYQVYFAHLSLALFDSHEMTVRPTRQGPGEEARDVASAESQPQAFCAGHIAKQPDTWLQSVSYPPGLKC